MTDGQFKSFLINLLRAGTFKWRPRGEARKRYRTKMGVFKNGKDKYGYRCAKCKEVFKAKDTQIDHFFAVVSPIEGFTTLDNYAKRMFCSSNNFICLCIPCHGTKTKRENEYRANFKKIIGMKTSVDRLSLEYYEFLKRYKEDA